VRAAARSGIEILTVFAFSEENWKRDPKAKSRSLMDLVRAFALREAAECARRTFASARSDASTALPARNPQRSKSLRGNDGNCDGMLLNLALNYGARSELCDAIRALAARRPGRNPRTRGPRRRRALEVPLHGRLPDPDLLIRTGGELRVSNFLLYQIAYSELWSTPANWPAFDERLLHEALERFRTAPATLRPHLGKSRRQASFRRKGGAGC
jgi:undecaprenyl diphosphate synthase